MFCPALRRTLPSWLWGFVFLALAVLLAFQAPQERVLKEGVRAVYLHGAWMWTGLGGFLLASTLGLWGWWKEDETRLRQARAWAWVATGFWLTALPISLWTMQLNWNGLFLAEPRWKVALAFGIAGALLQAGLLFFPLRVGALVNALYTLALVWFLWRSEQILHPPSPIFGAKEVRFPLHFLVTLLALFMAAWSWARTLAQTRK